MRVSSYGEPPGSFALNASLISASLIPQFSEWLQTQPDCLSKCRHISTRICKNTIKSKYFLFFRSASKCTWLLFASRGFLPHHFLFHALFRLLHSKHKHGGCFTLSFCLVPIATACHRWRRWSRNNISWSAAHAWSRSNTVAKSNKTNVPRTSCFCASIASRRNLSVCRRGIPDRCVPCRAHPES